MSLDEVDLVICGGIARQYFEPATAMEVAAKLGLKRTHAFDVTAACVGHLEAMQVAAAYLEPARQLSHRAGVHVRAVGPVSELRHPDASATWRSRPRGLTIGNAAACMLLRRKPLPGGGIRLRAINTFTAPDHWHLCQVPIGGTLVSSSVELMRLGQVDPALGRRNVWRCSVSSPRTSITTSFTSRARSWCARSWRTSSVDPAKGVYTHALLRQHRQRQHRRHVQPAARGADREARRQDGARQRGRRFFHGDGGGRVDGVIAVTQPLIARMRLAPHPRPWQLQCFTLRRGRARLRRARLDAPARPTAAPSPPPR